MTVVCSNCGLEVVSKRKDAIYCSNKCGNRVRGRRYDNNNPESVKQNRDKQNTKVERRMLSRIKCRAKRDGIPFNLEESDISIPEFCPVLGLKLVLINQGSGYHVDSPSLDRIDPKLGYTKGNVRVISARANLLKNDATLIEMRLVLQDLERIDDARYSF
jgi:hypothetical protein